MATEARSHGATEVAAQMTSSTGAMLRSAREAAGLSLEQVAQQLKLAPRQVKALEDESFADLPGRTFSRGFVRNYARLLNLDAQDLLAHLPDVAHAPALDSPALHATGSMAELPSAATSRTSAGRWLIPFALAACIVAAAAYEFYRGGLGSSGETPRAQRDALPQTAPSAPSAQSVMTLPNPLAGEKTDASAAGGAIAAPDAPAGSVAGASAASDAPLVLSFEGPSWTEVRDASGQLIVSRLIAAHSVESVRGAAPFDVFLGNARAVTVSYLGKPVDLAPYTRQNTARLTLK